MLSRSNTHRVSLQRQRPRTQIHERERGRSRTPKPTAMALELRGQTLPCQYIPPPSRTPCPATQQVPRAPLPHTGLVARPRRALRPKGKSPDRSVPGALEDAIHEAHARGDLRQCLQWVLEIQGIFLDWDDPRLDTVTEDDLCFSEQTGMGPDATPEERRRAEAYWAMRKAEEDEAQDAWERTATPAEKEASRLLRAKYEAERSKREARAQFFRAPRMDQVVLAASPPGLPAAPSAPSSLDTISQRKLTIPRTTPSQPQALFPVDDGELTTVRSMWLDQGRKGLTLAETLVCPTPEPSNKSHETTGSLSSLASDHRSPDDATSLTSASTSLSSSAPSALFSSVITNASTATSVSSTIVCRDWSPASDRTAKRPPAASKRVEVSVTTLAQRKLIPVLTSESPLHKHVAHVSPQKEGEEKEKDDYSNSSVKLHTDRTAPHRQRTTSGNWFSRGSKTVGGLVDFVGRLPSAYLSVSDRDAYLLRPASCPPPTHRTPSPRSPSPETIIHLLPLRPPVHPRTFPPLPTLPRSPYRRLTPPAHPTARVRCVPNPQFLRLKALQNRVLWGLVQVPRGECEVLAAMAARHRHDACPGRTDADRFGQMFTAREALVQVVVEGPGGSGLCYECAGPAGANGEGARLWGWLRSLG